MARVRSRQRVVTVAGLVVAMSACGGSTQEAAPTRGTPPVSLEHVGSIGCVECEGPEQLSVFAVGFGPDDTIALTNRYEPLVRVFRPDGELVAAFGRYGEGPGELGLGDQVPPWLACPTSGGSLWIYEPMPATLTAFATDGAFAGDEVRLADRFPFGLGCAADSPHLYLLSSGSLGGAPGVHRVDVSSGESVPILEDLEEFPLGDPDLGNGLPLAAVPTGGFALGDPRAYRVRVYDADGRLQREFGRDVEPPAKTDERLREQLDRERDAAARSGRPQRDIPSAEPHFDRLGFAFDAVGRLWIATLRGAAGQTILDVFDADGGHLAEIELPVELKREGWILRSMAAGAGTLVLATVGPGGEDVVEVYRVSEPATGEATSEAGE